MEDSDVGGQVTLDESTVKARLKNLEILQEELDAATMRIRTVRAEQSGNRWTAIPACQDFARTYSDTLRALEANLAHLRRRVTEMQDDLHRSARALVAADVASHDRLAAVQTRIDAASTSPATPSAPAGPAPTAPTPGPAPAAPLSWDAVPGQA